MWTILFISMRPCCIKDPRILTQWHTFNNCFYRLVCTLHSFMLCIFLGFSAFLLFLYSVSHLLTSYTSSFMLCLKSGSPGINLWTSFAPKIGDWSCCWFLIFILSQSWFLIYRFTMTGMVYWWVRPGNVMFFYQSRTLSNVCTCVKLVKVTPGEYVITDHSKVVFLLWFIIVVIVFSLSLFLFAHYFVLAF